MTIDQFKTDFEKKFGNGAWVLEFGDGPLSFHGFVTIDEDPEDGTFAFSVWPDEDKDYRFRVDPKTTIIKDNQWEVWNLIGKKRRWAIRVPRADQEIRRG